MFDFNNLPEKDSDYRFPLLLNKKKLLEKRLGSDDSEGMSKGDFLANYFQMPISDSERLFQEIYFYEQEEIENIFLFYYFGVDIATGKQLGDYTAISVVGVTEDYKHMYLVDCYCQRIILGKFTLVLVDFLNRYTLEKGVIEGNIEQHWQDGLADDIDTISDGHLNWVMKSAYKPLLCFEKTSQGKEERITSIEPKVTSGQIKFPDIKEYKNKSYSEYYRQIEKYTIKGSSHDDAPDSLHIAIKLTFEDKKKKGY